MTLVIHNYLNLLPFSGILHNNILAIFLLHYSRGTLYARRELTLESRSNRDASRLVDSQMTCSAFLEFKRSVTTSWRPTLPKNTTSCFALCVAHPCINDSTMIDYTATLNIARTCEMNLIPRSLGHMRHPYVVIPKAAFT